jgi:hypothetical protein
LINCDKEDVEKIKASKCLRNSMIIERNKQNTFCNSKIDIPVFLITEIEDKLDVEYFAYELKKQLAIEEHCNIGIISNSVLSDIFSFEYFNIDTEEFMNFKMSNFYNKIKTYIINNKIDILFICLTGSIIPNKCINFNNNLFLKLLSFYIAIDYFISLYPYNTIIYDSIDEVSKSIEKYYSIKQDFICISNKYSVNECSHTRDVNLLVELTNYEKRENVFDTSETDILISNVILSIRKKLSSNYKEYFIL